MLSYVATLLCTQCKCTCDTHYSNVIHIALVRSIRASVRSRMTLNASRYFDIQCIDVYIAIPQIPIDYHTYIAIICQTYMAGCWVACGESEWLPTLVIFKRCSYRFWPHLHKPSSHYIRT